MDLNMLLTGLEMGFYYAPLALGVYISYRILRFVDITVDGTFLLGGAVAAALVLEGHALHVALAGSLLAGALAGMMTGLLITKLRIQRILAGILVMTALYSVNQRILGGPILRFEDHDTLHPLIERITLLLFGTLDEMEFLGVLFIPDRVGSVVLYGLIACALCGVLLVFFHTRLGLAIRGAGSNEDAVRAMGADVSTMIVIALAVSNAAAALSGALFAMELGNVGISEGVGTIVTGLACVMIGSALFVRTRFSLQFVSSIIGSLTLMVLISQITRDERLSADIKLFTALFVVVALLLPRWLQRLRGRSVAAAKGE